MHPDLLNNSHFLRYYNQWQEDPASIVFAPIAEYLLFYGKLEEAEQVCLEGLKHHPNLVSGHLVLAKVYLQQKKYDEVKETLKKVFSLVPNHEGAVALLKLLEEMTVLEMPQQKKRMNWETVTMARIFAAQGHVDQARQVYHNILLVEPHNEEAKRGLSELQIDNR